MIQNILMILLGVSILVSWIFIYKDKKKRVLTKRPFCSFLLATYNDGSSVERTIKSIYESYDNFEVIIVNDCSKDNTLEILNSLKYKFKLLNNDINLGKADSINRAFKESKGEIVFVLDTDTIINKESIEDVLARFEHTKNLGGVSCRYKVLNQNKLLGKLQDLEYVMLGFLQASYNHFSCLAMWGGCSAYRREAFEKIEGLSRNFIIEDADSALKLNEAGYKVEQSNVPVYSEVPDKVKSWYKQKIRWTSGTMQCMLKHPKQYITHPLIILVLPIYSLFILSFTFGLFNNYSLISAFIDSFNAFKDLGYSVFNCMRLSFLEYSSVLLSKLFYFAISPLFSLPYLIFDKRYRNLNLLWVFPFVLIYYPIFVIVSLIGFIVGIKRYPYLSKGNRAW